MTIHRNTAGQSVSFQAIDITTGAPVTVGTPTTQYTLDNGAQTTTTNTATHKGNGTWILDLTQAETDGKSVSYAFQLTNAINRTLDIQTEEAIRDANTVALSDDAAAAANLTAMFDGTGYIDPAAPAYQAQVEDIALTGTAVNTPYAAWNITTGSVVSGTPDDTIAQDGVYYQIQAVGGILDMEIEFEVGNDGIPTQNVILGRLSGFGNTLAIEAYDWANASFQQLGDITSTIFPFDATNVTPLFTHNVGTGSDAGKVRIRLSGTGLGTANLFIDQTFQSFSVVNRSVGYADGSVWVDLSSGNTGAVPFIDGVADRPCGSWADAQTVASEVGLRRFNVRSGGIVILDANMGGSVIEGENYELDLRGFVAPSLVQRGIVIGSESGSSETYYYQCSIGDDTGVGANIPMTATSNSVFKECGITHLALNTTADGDFQLADCFQSVVNNDQGFALIDFGASTTSNRTVEINNWSGFLIIDEMRAGDEVTISGVGTLGIGPGVTGGNVFVNGDITVSNLGSPTLLEVNRIWNDTASDYIEAGSIGELLNDLEISMGIVEPAVEFNELVLAKVDTMLEDDGASGWQYTTLALENAPSSGGVTPADVWSYSDGNGFGTKSQQLGSTQELVINIENVTDRVDTMLQLNGEGSAYQYTIDALENAPSGGGGGSCVVLPSAAVMPNRDKPNAMTLFVEETAEVSISVFEYDGVTPVDMTGQAPYVVWEDYDRNDIAIVPTGSISIGGPDNNVLTFDIPAAVTAKADVLSYAIRRTADEYVFASGPATVSYVPFQG